MHSFKKQQCTTTTEKPAFTSTCLSDYSQVDEKENISIRRELRCEASHSFYKVLFIGKVRFTVSNGKMFDDGCVAFEDTNGTLAARFIRAIKHSHNSNFDTVFYIEKFSIQKLHSININVDNQSSPLNITCSDFAFIQLTNTIVPVTPNQVIKKLSYIQTNTKDFIIISYPNLLESS